MSSTSFSFTGRVQSGEQDVMLWPRNPYDVNKRGVIYCHGASNGAWVAYASHISPGQVWLLRRLADLGYPIIAADLGVNKSNFGNSEHVTRIGQARTYLGTLGVRNDKVHIVGSSMGNIGGLKYALANPTLVASITGIIPAYNIQRHRDLDTGPGLRASIDTAWGVTYPAALPAGANAADNINSLVGVVPWRGYYATDDAEGLVADAVDLGALFGNLTSLGALGHTDAAIGSVNPRELAAWFDRYE